MTKEYAYAYEAGYRDGSTNYELEHCPACKNVADLQDALAEIGELRIEADCLCDENECLVSENAELRELCESLFRLANNECLSGTRDCDDCPMNRSEPPCSLALDFIAMRRLGIDVTPWVVKRVEVNE